jgi:putative methionine-R-sulfoxide reductase with GAF domain
MDTLGANSSAGSGLRTDPVVHERRRRPRLPAHTPAYAMLSVPSDGVAVPFNEILDANEDGICISSSAEFDSHKDLDLCLDLPETQTQVRTPARVVWSDKGRVGLRFAEIPQPSLHELREWLHLNGIVAAADEEAALSHAAGSTQIHSADGELIETPDSPETPDFSSLLVALEAVRRETLALAPNVEVALQLLAERARTFTRASGAAIALFEGSTEEMICHASAGEAPRIGSALQIGSGFSGQCVRTGKLLRCDDSELNLFVDRESCRALGIRSMIATPIGPRDSVKGLLEVFSPKPGSFSSCDDAVLGRLADVAFTAIQSGTKPAPTVNPEYDQDVVTEEKLKSLMQQLSSSHSRRLALILTAAVVAIIGLLLFIPRFRSQQTPAAPPIQQVAPVASVAVGNPLQANDLDSLRRLADAGNAAAQFAVGAHYATGDGVMQDYSEAVRWFTRAAEQGHVVAQGTLGAYYWNALGVHQDLKLAYFWSILAQAGGDQASKYRASILASRLTRGEVVAAQQQANDWMEQHQRPALSH